MGLTFEQVVSGTKTPYAVICDAHGRIFLTDAGYSRQMDFPDKGWICPICGQEAQFDDANYDEHFAPGPEEDDEPAF